MHGVYIYIYNIKIAYLVLFFGVIFFKLSINPLNIFGRVLLGLLQGCHPSSQNVSLACVAMCVILCRI
jgi:hypothetical protein